ncbi:Por secretion system C-terminal sorting domain-containing protein [Aquiflexum balticum DSM 16537]|uniref:Por secretion system C-terminal sorting domain-containing protein n=1 Tax=Aquiflexum balticum DSM 16537 TaxID=758820 RepID=A0A1W2H811_9BACT|nr:T9SS type A sorting domain-containing protein [Aquiflexum balticum]SMD45051.1 Por secretion system C-terminal sorting domain-containing protein [Aquiflexum balticum DSM 16537]
MKNFTLITFFIMMAVFSVKAQSQMNLPVTFDDPEVNYGIVGFGGADDSAIVEDPTDANNKVARVTKTAVAELWAGATVTAVTNNVQTGFASRIPFTATQTKMSVRVWSPDAGIQVRLKVEDHLDPTKSVETEATTTVANGWQILTFDFANQAAGTSALNLSLNYNKASIFFNFGVTGAEAGEKTYYFDDMVFITEGDGGDGGNSGNSGPVFPVTFEEDVTWTEVITNFDGGELTVVDNPDTNGNPSAKVGKMVKNAGQPWGGSFMLMGENIDLSAGTAFTVAVWAPRANTKMLFKIENENDGAQAFEQELTIAESNQWVDVTFDMGGANRAFTYKKVVMIFDLGTVGDGSAGFTWYVDNIRQVAGNGGGDGGNNTLNLPVTFDEELDYGLTDFGGNASEIIVDPTDAANKVAKSVKTAESELWAGTTVGGTAGFASAIPFASGATKMSLRVWSPTAGIPVRLKVEASNDPTISVETEATVTVASQWQTLTFDFANQAEGTEAINFSRSYNKASVFFNFGTTGAAAGEQTYYWDDLVFGSDDDGGDGGNSGSSGPVFPVTFEEDITWTEVITNFDGGELTVVDNPDTNGNPSAKVGRMVKNAGQPWGGSFMMMGENIDFSAGTAFTVAVWAPRANTKMLFKIENENDGAQAFEQELTIAESNQWVDVTFDMGGANRAFTYKKVVMIFDLGTVGDGSAGFTWYVDNIRQGEGNGNGGGEVGENLIINGDFASGLNSWTPFIADFAGVSATVAATEGEASITGIAGAGGEIWHVQFNQIFTAAQIEALEVGQDYIAKFDARSSVASRSLRLYFGEDGGGFAGVSVTDHTLNTEMQTIEVPFNLGNKYGAMKFGFEMGLSNDPVFIRNVSLTKVDGGGNGGGGNTNLGLPVTFDEDLDYGLTDFGGNASEIVVDPTDAANKVAKSVKSAEAELWAGTTVGGTAGFASAIPFASGATKMSLRVWSPTAGIPVRIKVEASNDPTISVETEATVTVASQWQTLTFDFANQAAGTEAINFSRSYNKASVFFNFGTTGAVAGEQTYYWDDLVFGSDDDGGSGGSSGPVFPVTFEEDITWTEVITNFDGGELTVVDNPDTNGNSSAKVGRMVKNAGQPWGGSFMMMGENIDLSTSTQFTVAVWAPRANTKMLFKIENENDGAQAFEQELTIAESNQWVDVTFDMGGANRAFTYKKVVMIFDLGTVGDGSAGFTWYVDNIRQGEGNGNGGGEVGENLIINGDFAAGLNSWTPFIADFAGVSATVAASEGEASITNIAGAGGQIWHVQFNQIFTAAQIEALEVGQDYIAKFDARSSVAGRALRLYFGEDGGGFAGVSVTDHTLNTEMQTIEVPFNLGNKYGAMKFGFEMGLSNDPVFISNVSLTKVDGVGGGDTKLELPVTFDTEFDYGLTDFGGNASEIVVDPTNGGNIVAKSVKSAEAELWAGTTLGGTAGFASAIPFAEGATKMSLRVWSPTAGIPIRIKVEDSNDPTISVETEATVTVASQWQTLIFDFANQAAGTEAINFSRNYNKASVFFNFGTTGAVAGEQTYYWDDMVFGELVQEEQVITFPEIEDKTLGDAPFNLNASSTSGLVISFSSDNNNVSISGGVATLVNPGRTSITASQSGNLEFFPAAPVSHSFCINPAKPVISVTGQGSEEVTLTSSSATGNQWFLDGVLIADATGSSIVVSTLGTYTVQVSIDDCVSQLSEEVTLIVSSARFQQIRELTAFPNPVENYLHVRGLSGPLGNSEMIDMAGRSTTIVFEELENGYQADVSRLSPGIYLLRLQQGNKNYSLKIIKK